MALDTADDEQLEAMTSAEPIATLTRYSELLDSVCNGDGYLFTAADRREMDEAIMRIRILMRDFKHHGEVRS